MELPHFLKLIRDKEKANVDFKIKSDAFAAKELAPNAELAKDICAMANNGHIASYILIGVSDDGGSFLSVENEKLTDDRLQSFCKEAVSPPPLVRLEKVRWKDAPKEISGKTFVVIKVGPNPRHAHRLNRDYIRYEEKVCYRRNEVWIRRGATSDLATPEEVSRLAKGQPPHEKVSFEGNEVYSRQQRGEIFNAVREDLAKLMHEIGGAISGRRIVLPIRNTKFVMSFQVYGEVVGSNSVFDIVRDNWRFEHGVLVISLGTVSKSAMPRHASVSFKEKWGKLAILDLSVMRKSYMPSEGPRSDLVPLIPDNNEGVPISIVALPNITETVSLRSGLLEFKEFTENDNQTYPRLKESKDRVDASLLRWLKQGWLRRAHEFETTGSKAKMIPYVSTDLAKEAEMVLAMAAEKGSSAKVLPLRHRRLPK